MHLIHCRQLNRKAIRILLHHDPELSNLYSLNASKLKSLLYIDSKKATAILQELHSVPLPKLIELYKSRNISMVSFADREYPTLLKEIHDPPLLLFAIGDTKLLHQHALAVVGARHANDYARRALDILLPPLIEHKLVIVSGLAKGTDTLAHKWAMEKGGKTIAVLGGGFFHIYPSENRKLAEHFQKEHLLISEYPPVWRPEKWHFPMRNRIISGLSKGTLIIQAKERSGSLITADYALEQGKEVFAVPGHIDEPLCTGTNDLIQQGAKLVFRGEDILNELYLEKIH